MAAAALDEAAVDHHRAGFVFTQQRLELLRCTASLDDLAPVVARFRLFHEGKVLGARDVLLLVGVLIGHGVDDHQLLALVHPGFQLGHGQQLIAPLLRLLCQLHSRLFQLHLLLELVVATAREGKAGGDQRGHQSAGSQCHHVTTPLEREKRGGKFAAGRPQASVAADPAQWPPAAS